MNSASSTWPAHLGVQLLESCAEVGREQVMPRGSPLAPLDERRARALKRRPAHHMAQMANPN